MLFRNFLIFSLLLFSVKAFCQQQDVDFHLNGYFLQGKTILKVKRDFYDPYLWVLAKNNEVFRVNCLTKSIDDYTSTFAAYNNLQFVDIAGRSRDTVFIATNSTNVIYYKNGSIHIIGTADGIPGIVNSVGMAMVGVDNIKYSASSLMIGTDKGFRLYDSNTETMTYKSDDGNSKIYEATYRTGIYKDSSDLTSNIVPLDTIQFQPVVFSGDAVIHVGFLLEGGNEFGYNINTATEISTSMYAYNMIYTDLFWGNSRGMFQDNANYSSVPFVYPPIHYLDGISVNKITDIYGLSQFGNGGFNENPGLIKQTMLVGTDNGLYFSSSIYSQANGLINLALFHDDDLGNVVVNDICTDESSVTIPVCEDGVWLACNDGLYFLKPDYAKYLNSQKLKIASFEGVDISVADTLLCSGSSITMKIDSSIYSGNTIQWYKDSVEMPQKINDSLRVNVSGDYYAVLYSTCENIHVETNHLKVQVISAPIFSFNYPDKLQYCDSLTATLQTTNNSLYHYRWYTNGVLNGNTTSSYTVTQTGKYKVEVSACTNSWVPSKEVEVDLVTLPVPQVTPDKSVYCAEDVAVLTENAPADPSYTINWYRDGTLLTADNNLTTISETTPGSYAVVLASTIATCTQTSAALPLAFTPAPVFTFNYPAQLQYCTGTPLTLQVTGSANYQYRWYDDGTLNGVTTASLPVTQNGKYKVEVSSCAGSRIASKEVQVNFVTVPVPAITTDKPVYCIGDNATLSLAQTTDPDYTIQWYKDNVPVPNSIGQSFIVTNMAGNYTVALAYSTPNTDGSTCSQSSAVQAITFNPPPTVSIEKIVNTTICDGQTIGLKVNYNGGTVQWSTGETTDQVNVTKAGTYTATITSTAGCQAAASIDITFLRNPVFSVSDTSICTYKKQVVTLTAPSGFAQYAWNGQTGGQTYQVSLPQTVSLTVTDLNGCQATQQIKVADQCPNIYIPNTFTPNGDGVNDTWVIEGLDSDPGSTVKVFTRNGVQVFNSIGYGTPWNGEYNGKKLPAGAYYYIVTAKNGTQNFSGSLTIIY